MVLRAGRLPEAGHPAAGGPRVSVRSGTHLRRQDGGGRVRHRPLPETHDQVGLDQEHMTGST